MRAVTCRACGAPLVPGARFCATCGAPVELSCAACGGPIPPSGRFCPACGTPVAPGPAGSASEEERPAPQRERKVATLLFADLVGFTSLGESHDPEVVGAIVSQVFARLGAEIARYEGTIEKHAGDAMLAVFGVPSIHEDDPERAVRAALEMQGAMVELAAELRAAGRPETSLRIGIETGEVLADLSRLGGERDLFVTGDAVNTAARLQQAAAPGSVVVGPATYAATRDVVEYEELLPTALKGKAIPVAAWRAIAVKARRGGVRTPLGIESPVVGRDAEIAILKETVRRTVADGRPHLVTVIGAAGVGKSRLTWELEKYLDGLPETYHWRKGRCLAYAQASYSALADAIKADARILDDDAPSTAVAKLDDRIQEVHGAAPDPAIATALRAVLALGPIGTLPRDVLFEAWRRHLDAVARLAPLVLVLEDIHWADEGLLDVIEFLARWGEGPVTIICLARHELLERRPGWGGGTLNAATIVLEPLDHEESTRLVDGLLGDGVPTDLRERIVGLADGNPLFAEELVRMFVDRGVLRTVDGRWELAAAVEDVEVPGSIQAVLAARLDGLPAPEKRIAQQAAVVGRIFWDAVVAHLSRQGRPATADLLRRLRVKELVVPREPSSLAGAAEYGFRHVLIRDVAYDSLAKRDRASLHLDVARWAEEALADRRDELVELLAAHYVAALRYEEEFGAAPERLAELRRTTLDYARRAVRRAYGLRELETATRWMRIAVEQARRLGMTGREFLAIAEEYAEIAWWNETGAAAAAVHREAIDSMLSLPDLTPDDRARVARVWAELGRALYTDQRIDEARETLERALEDYPDGEPGRLDILAALGWVHWRLGRLDLAAPMLEDLVARSAAAGREDIRRWALHDLGIVRSMSGDPAGATLLEESFILAKVAGDEKLIGRCYVNLPSVLMSHGADWHEVMPLMEDGLDRARRSVNRGGIAWIAGNYAELLWLLGRVRDALALYEEATAEAEAIGDREIRAGRQAGAAAMNVLLGERERGRALMTDEVRRLARDEPQMLAYNAATDAWLLLPDTEAAVARLLEVARRPGFVINAEVVAAWLVRIGYRAQRRDAIAAGVDLLGRNAVRAEGPYMQATVAAIEGLADGTPAGLERVTEAARRLEKLGYLLPAAEAFADAALLAARLGRDGTDDAVRARELFAACSVVPLLGDPVEAIGVPEPAG